LAVLAALAALMAALLPGSHRRGIIGASMC
jgi:hypothetical protein